MSRYVDAEWLIKESMPLSFSVQKWVNEVQIMIAPSIDIVFCKECKHHFYDELNDCKMCHIHEYGEIWEDDDYCSYGEREGE